MPSSLPHLWTRAHTPISMDLLPSQCDEDKHKTLSKKEKKKDKHKTFKARVMRIGAVPTSAYLCEMDIISRFDQDIFEVLRARSTMKSYCIGCLHAKERPHYDITGKSKSCSEDLGPS